MVCSSASMFLFSIHILQFTSLTWHHCRNTCWFGNRCVIDCYSRFLGACIFFVMARGCLSYISSCRLVNSVFFLRVLRLPGSSFYLFWSFLFWQNNSFAFFCGFVVLIALYIVLMFVIVYLFFSPCGYLTFFRTINMKAVTFSIQADR